ncbi:MAG: hypothetical protein JWO88_2762 [Frankiales bacterium]|nr:hypothetical protein [Frankiales bacterium]
MSIRPHDVTDLHLAPVLLALDARISEMALLDHGELVQRVAVESDRPDWTEDMRRAGLLKSVEHFVDLAGWTLGWDPRGLRLKHGRHHVVLGVPSTFQDYIVGTDRPVPV